MRSLTWTPSLLLFAACADDPAPVPDANLSVAMCAPSAGGFSLVIDNPLFPLPVGQLLVYDGEEDGAALHLEIRVLDQTEVVAGVTTRVVEEHEREDGETIEISRNFFVQAADGTVCYYGEDVDIYQGGVVVAHDGAWRASATNLPGIIMPAAPAVGDVYPQELAPGVAEDHAEVMATAASVTTPAGTFTGAIETREWTPLEPGHVGVKAYAPGIGLVVDNTIELTRRPAR